VQQHLQHSDEDSIVNEVAEQSVAADSRALFRIQYGLAAAPTPKPTHMSGIEDTTANDVASLDAYLTRLQRVRQHQAELKTQQQAMSPPIPSSPISLDGEDEEGEEEEGDIMDDLTRAQRAMSKRLYAKLYGNGYPSEKQMPGTFSRKRKEKEAAEKAAAKKAAAKKAASDKAEDVAEEQPQPQQQQDSGGAEVDRRSMVVERYVARSDALFRVDQESRKRRQLRGGAAVYL
jgi:hypothetical protein